MVASLARADKSLHHETIVVTFGAKLTLDDRLHAHSDKFWVLNITDRLEIAEGHSGKLIIALAGLAGAHHRPAPSHLARMTSALECIPIGVVPDAPSGYLGLNRCWVHGAYAGE